MSTSKTYQIRYNTVSKDDNERWRLIENGNETLVANIIIDGSTYTTKDWMEEIQDYKWHVTNGQNNLSAVFRYDRQNH